MFTIILFIVWEKTSFALNLIVVIEWIAIIIMEPLQDKANVIQLIQDPIQNEKRNKKFCVCVFFFWRSAFISWMFDTSQNRKMVRSLSP